MPTFRFQRSTQVLLSALVSASALACSAPAPGASSTTTLSGSGSVPDGRYSAVGALGPDSNWFYIAGGGSSTGVLRDAWRLNLAEKRWERLGDLPEPMLRGTATRVGSTLLVFGGENSDGMQVNALWEWDLESDTWTLIDEGGGPSPRKKQAAAWTGEALIISGGIHDDAGTPVILDDVWAWTEGAWSQVSTTGGPGGSYRQGMAWDSERGLLWSFAGYDAEDARTNDLWSLEPGAQAPTWQLHEPTTSPPPVRASHTLIVAPGSVLGTPGNGLFAWGGHAADVDGWVFDPSDESWTDVPTELAPLARDAQVADISSDGQTLYLLCGDPVSQDVPNFVCDAWGLDLLSMTWTELAGID